MTSLCGVLLAAGEGRRMGGAKALLELEGTTLVEQHVARLVEIGCASVVVVVRPAQAEAVRALLRPYATARVEAVSTDSQAESLAAALGVLGLHDVLVITPVDLLPALPSTYRALLAGLSGEALAVTPVCAGRGGHPVIARRSLLVPFAVRPLRDVLRDAGDTRRRIEVSDPRVLGDFDTPSDLSEVRTRG